MNHISNILLVILISIACSNTGTKSNYTSNFIDRDNWISNTNTVDTHKTVKQVNNFNVSNDSVTLKTYSSIASDLNLILSDKALNTTKYGIAIYSNKLNKWIFTKNHRQLLVPASNTKLVTTFTTYDLLGENHQVTTSIVTDGKIENGTLNGNIYIVGQGDPLLSVSDIESIADGIKTLGINKINGNIYGDGSFFDKETNRFIYSGDRDEVQATAPITALAIDKNIISVIVTSGTTPGKPVNVQFKPASSAFGYSNSATISTQSQPKGKIKQQPKKQKVKAAMLNFDNNEYHLYAGDSKSKITKTKQNTKNKKTNKSISNPIRITSSLQEDGKQIFYIKGCLPVNRTYTYKCYIQNPEFVVAGVLKDRLLSGGVTVNGNIGKKELSQNEKIKYTTLYSFTRNINDIISITNKQSDNYLAETLFKINGATSQKNSNIAKSASFTALQALENNNIDITGFVFNDGSGLSRRNLITAEGLAKLLIQARNKSFYNAMESSFSIAGIDGTLTRRMLSSDAYANLKGKTGTHANVSSLAGVVRTRNGDTLCFAYIFNGGSVGLYKQLEDKISIKIAEY